MRTPSLLDQLRALVAMPPTSECRLFPGSIGGEGYGQVWVGDKTQKAHRVAWELYNQQKIPAGMHVLHSCIQTRSCVNPGHLRIGTHQDNMDDCTRDGTHSRQGPKGNANGSRLHPERLSRGEDHGRAVLTANDVREIRERLARGEAGRSIAMAFGVTQQNISLINCGRKWKHLDPERSPNNPPDRRFKDAE